MDDLLPSNGLTLSHAGDAGSDRTQAGEVSEAAGNPAR